MGERIARTKVGNVEIVALLDAHAQIPPTAIFPQTTIDAWKPYAEFMVEDATQIALSITSFLLRSGGKNVIIDTGMGAKDRQGFPNGCLPEVLREAGVAPEEIDLVLATHIHVDHVGGHTIAKGDGWAPAFPKARHIFVREEWDHWTSEEIASSPHAPWVPDCVLPLRNVAEIELVDGESTVTDEITMLATPGHTVAHTSFAITSAGESAVILGDVAHHPAQINETSWSPVFDMNPTMAAETRERFFQRMEDEKTRVLAGHFPFPGIGSVMRVDGRRWWRASA